MEDLEKSWEIAEGTETQSLKEGCYPLIAQLLLTDKCPTKFKALQSTDFERVVGSVCSLEHASEEQKLHVILKGPDVADCTPEQFTEHLDKVDMSRVSEDFLLDLLSANPWFIERRDLR